MPPPMLEAAASIAPSRERPAAIFREGRNFCTLDKLGKTVGFIHLSFHSSVCVCTRTDPLRALLSLISPHPVRAVTSTTRISPHHIERHSGARPSELHTGRLSPTTHDTYTHPPHQALHGVNALLSSMCTLP